MDYKTEALNLVKKDHFIVTSTHPNWRGKVECEHCGSTGYAAMGNANWWGLKHGKRCKIKEFK